LIVGRVWSEVKERTLDTRDEFYAGNVDVALRITEFEDQLRRNTPTLCRIYAKCPDAEGVIFEY
jgi:hypothetical protein